MAPVASEGLHRGFSLGPLVLVVGELKVQTPTVQVETLAEQVEGHHHALGVPAGPSFAEGRRPARLAGLGVLPQREIER